MISEEIYSKNIFMYTYLYVYKNVNPYFIPGTNHLLLHLLSFFPPLSKLHTWLCIWPYMTHDYMYKYIYMYIIP